MKHSSDNIIGLFSGLIGGSTYAWISWNAFFEGAAKLMWVAIIAAISGAAGVAGKYLMNKYIKRKK
jgi:nicotinamide riboside transporter PnuC